MWTKWMRRYWLRLKYGRFKRILLVIGCVLGVMVGFKYMRNDKFVDTITNIDTVPTSTFEPPPSTPAHIAVAIVPPELIQKRLAGYKETFPVGNNPGAADFTALVKVFDLQREERRLEIREAKSPFSYLYAVMPEIVCETMVRAGKVAHGGRWVCNPWLMPKKCTVFSLGVPGSSTFEEEMAWMTHNECTIHSFDRNASYQTLFTGLSAKFFPYEIMDTTNAAANQYTIRDLMAKFGKSKVDILNVDIGGAEHWVLPDVLKNPNEPLFCQVLLEIHGGYQTYTSLLTQLSSAGYLLFQRHTNEGYTYGSVYEYDFIHKSCLTQYGITTGPFHHNFPDH